MVSGNVYAVQMKVIANKQARFNVVCEIVKEREHDFPRCCVARSLLLPFGTSVSSAIHIFTCIHADFHCTRAFNVQHGFASSLYAVRSIDILAFCESDYFH